MYPSPLPIVCAISPSAFLPLPPGCTVPSLYLQHGAVGKMRPMVGRNNSHGWGERHTQFGLFLCVELASDFGCYQNFLLTGIPCTTALASHPGLQLAPWQPRLSSPAAVW
ncbi:IQ domain-containing protein E [Platysternon megacephalum]|uniref:IQ domain-containing protein E n=1 Tax=Platysternon megacephalum TaxID=55544 RepID=A0A4D9EKF7_9SAUR|nr:IQ domain-containing protein E [Platysternon megacephalum]